jgi:hypothetical protein
MKTLSLAAVVQRYNYDPESGIFTWKIAGGAAGHRMHPGDIAGQFDPKNGYVRLRIDGRIYLAHRVAWLVMNGEMPKAFIDHRNGIKSDNRIENLREATKSKNQQNIRICRANKTGVRGVWKDPRPGRGFVAYISIDGKRKNLGSFESIQEAAIIRREAEAKYFGEFAPNHHR